MARWKNPDSRNPGRDGFTRLPEPGAGGPAAGGRSRAAVEADLKRYGMDSASRAKARKVAVNNFKKNVETLSGRDALKKIYNNMTKTKREYKIERARDKAKKGKMN